MITFPGFLRVYVEWGDEEADGGDDEVRLPPLRVGESVDPREIIVEDHATKPPARYTEASLVKALEERGIGRPSTYASIIATIQDRGYVWKKGTALVPTFTAFAVVGLLERHFGTLVDTGFTASMEDDLDEIASGAQEAVPWLSRFYFGTGGGPLDSGRGLKDAVSTHLDEIDAREVNSIGLGVGPDGREIVARVGRYGPYLQRGEDRASIPPDLSPDELTLERAVELLEAPAGDRELGIDPTTGKTVIARAGRYGPYVQLGEIADAGAEKPRTASLLKSQDLALITLEEALQLLTLPRTVGVDPEGREIIAANGRYGPFLERGRATPRDTRSLESEEQMFTITLDEALALFAQPKTRAFGRTPAAPLRELGPDPVSGAMVVLRQGRFGPYVTDGTDNASLRRADAPENLTPERAFELLAERRAAGPRPARAKKAAGVKKAGVKAAAGVKKAGAAKKAGTAKKSGAAKKAGAAKQARKS